MSSNYLVPFLLHLESAYHFRHSIKSHAPHYVDHHIDRFEHFRLTFVRKFAFTQPISIDQQKQEGLIEPKYHWAMILDDIIKDFPLHHLPSIRIITFSSNHLVVFDFDNDHYLSVRQLICFAAHITVAASDYHFLTTFSIVDGVVIFA